MALTQKQEQFARLVAGGTDELDAIKKTGYKASSASKQAYRMAQNMAVQNRIAELKAIYAIQKSDKDSEPKQAKQAISANYETLLQEKLSALDFLRSVYTDACNDMKTRIQAAMAVLPYEEAKVAQIGKKDSEKDTAKSKSEQGKFATFSHQSDMFN